MEPPFSSCSQLVCGSHRVGIDPPPKRWTPLLSSFWSRKVFYGYGTSQYTDEFKREALGLLASSGWPLSQIAQELGMPPERLRAWRNKSGGSKAGSPRRPNTQAAIPPAGVDLATENARLRRENERLRMGAERS